MNAARESILPKIGVNSYELSKEAIQALPQGDNAPFDKVLLQTPGVYQDAASAGVLHIRNEHANLQYRINGIMARKASSASDSMTRWQPSQTRVNGFNSGQFSEAPTTQNGLRKLEAQP